MGNKFGLLKQWFDDNLNFKLWLKACRKLLTKQVVTIRNKDKLMSSILRTDIERLTREIKYLDIENYKETKKRFRRTYYKKFI